MQFNTNTHSAAAAALVLLVSFTSSFSFSYVPDKIASKGLQEIGLSAVEYSFVDQESTDLSPYFLKGEFKTRIRSSLVPALVGVGKAFSHDYEASAFTTAAVVNIMGQLYLGAPELKSTTTFKKIPSIIQSATKTYSRYQDGTSFNFYPPKKLEDGTIVRRPIDMTLTPIWYGFTNIPNDSDTSSSVMTSLIMQDLVTHNRVRSNTKLHSQKLIQEFGNYLDINRNPMFYNRQEGRKHTGSFMTWLMHEKDPKMPRFFFASSEKGQRIPFNKNDIDCIVNMNVLKLLKASKVDDDKTAGFNATCAMINDMISSSEEATCGVYYPNTYNLAYSIGSWVELSKNISGKSKAAAASLDQCISQNSKDLMVARIIKEQTAEGSWENINNIWQDPTLSTAYAVSALLKFGDMQKMEVRVAIFYGIHFLLKTAKLNKEGLIHWEEDHFFTATAIARSLIMWRSKAYTNLIIADILITMGRIYPQYNAENYLKLNF